MSKADLVQEGGAHYKKCPPEFQHWNLVIIHNWSYFQAQCIKYVMRYRDKNGIEDLKKAKHFIEKMIEMEESRSVKDANPLLGMPPEIPRTYTNPVKSTPIDSPKSTDHYTYEGGGKEYDEWTCRKCKSKIMAERGVPPDYYHSHQDTPYEV